MDSSSADWRANWKPSQRQSIIVKIFGTLKKSSPFGGTEVDKELEKLAEELEHNAYTNSTDLGGYFRQILRDSMGAGARTRHTAPINHETSDSSGPKPIPTCPASLIIATPIITGISKPIIDKPSAPPNPQQSLPRGLMNSDVAPFSHVMQLGQGTHNFAYAQGQMPSISILKQQQQSLQAQQLQKQQQQRILQLQQLQEQKNSLSASNQFQTCQQEQMNQSLKAHNLRSDTTQETRTPAAQKSTLSNTQQTKLAEVLQPKILPDLNFIVPDMLPPPSLVNIRQKVKAQQSEDPFSRLLQSQMELMQHLPSDSSKKQLISNIQFQLALMQHQQLQFAMLQQSNCLLHDIQHSSNHLLMALQQQVSSLPQEMHHQSNSLVQSMEQQANTLLWKMQRKSYSLLEEMRQQSDCLLREMHQELQSSGLNDIKGDAKEDGTWM